MYDFPPNIHHPHQTNAHSRAHARSHVDTLPPLTSLAHPTTCTKISPLCGVSLDEGLRFLFAVQVILQCGYGTPADMWSLAAMVFELLTGDLLFDPRDGAEFSRDEGLQVAGDIGCVQVTSFSFSCVPTYCVHCGRRSHGSDDGIGWQDSSTFCAGRKTLK